MTATAFGKQLRNPRTPLPKRLVDELRLWCELLENEHPGSPWLYWHKCRRSELSALPFCLDGTKALLYVTGYDALDRDLAKLMCITDYVLLHNPEEFGRALLFTHVPPDFSAFDEEPYLASHPLPPLVRTVLSDKAFELLLAEMIQVPGGGAVMCVPPPVALPQMVPKDDMAGWMKDAGYAMTTSSGCILWYPYYPDRFIEGEFLSKEVAYWRFFDAVPTWIGKSGWASEADASIKIDVPYIALSAAQSSDEWRQTWDAVSGVRRVFRLHIESLLELLGRGGFPTSGDLIDFREWSARALEVANSVGGSATTPSFPRVSVTTMTIELFRQCPQHSVWTSKSDELAGQVAGYSRAQCPQEVRQAPFMSLVLD